MRGNRTVRDSGAGPPSTARPVRARLQSPRSFRIILGFLIPLLVLSASWFAQAAYGLEPVRVGATLSLTGKYAEPSEMMRKAYLLWVKDVNARGGVLGRSVELTLTDDQSQPETARERYEEMVGGGRTDLVLAPYSTPITMAASDVTEKHGFVMIVCAASSKAIWERGYKYVFGIYALADRYFIGFLDLMAREDLGQICVIHENNTFNIEAAQGAVTWAKRMGSELLDLHGYDPGLENLSRALGHIQGHNPDGLIVCTYPPDGYALLRLMDERKYRPRALAMTITPIHPEFFKNAGPIGEGVFGASQWEPIERIPFPGAEKFIVDFTREYGLPPSYHSASAYASGQLLEKAAQDLGSLDQNRMREYIASLNTVTVLGRFKVDPTGRQVGHNPLLIQWQDGKKQIVYPPNMRTAEPRF